MRKLGAIFFFKMLERNFFSLSYVTGTLWNTVKASVNTSCRTRGEIAKCFSSQNLCSLLSKAEDLIKEKEDRGSYLCQRNNLGNNNWHSLNIYCIRHCSKHFRWINSFSSQNSPRAKYRSYLIWQVRIEKLSNLRKVTQQASKWQYQDLNSGVWVYAICLFLYCLHVWYI